MKEQPLRGYIVQTFDVKMLVTKRRKKSSVLLLENNNNSKTAVIALGSSEEEKSMQGSNKRTDQSSKTDYRTTITIKDYRTTIIINQSNVCNDPSLSFRYAYGLYLFDCTQRVS